MRELKFHKVCGSRYLITERAIENLVGPHIDELAAAGVTTVYYDEASIGSLSDKTPLPDSRRADIKADEFRNLIYTSGKSSFFLTCSSGVHRASDLV